MLLCPPHVRLHHQAGGASSISALGVIDRDVADDRVVGEVPGLPAEGLGDSRVEEDTEAEDTVEADTSEAVNDVGVEDVKEVSLYRALGAGERAE